MTSSVLLEISSVLGSDGVRVCHTTAGVDVLPMSCAPRGKGPRVDVRLNDNFTLSETTLAQLFGLLLPLVEGGGEPIAVDKDGFQKVVVLFQIPSQANNTERFGGLHGRS